MYQSGVGYIERAATVDSDAIVLRIRPDQINDILKSLTVIDDGAVTVSLPVDKATLDRLAQIPDQVKDGGVRALLDAFRGAHVAIRTRMRTYSGRIVGMESAPACIDGMQSTRHTVTLLVGGHDLRAIDLADIRGVSLCDKTIAEGLQKSLNISLNEGNWKQIELTIHRSSGAPREVAVSYIVSMPVWKPAYRLILRDDDRALLQGWAVVSNVTGSDWNRIAFSVISGSPMSFTYDLYKPQFLERQDLTDRFSPKAAAPDVIASGYGRAEVKRAKSVPMPPQPMPMGSAPAMFGGPFGASAPGGAPAPSSPMCDMASPSGFSETADVAQVGSFDEFRISSEFTLKDGNTALVSLIQDEVEARDTCLVKMGDSQFDRFCRGWRQNKSTQTVELVNGDAAALDSGPITLYRNHAVIGEGFLSRTEKKATAYITYANEGRLTVSCVDSKQSKRYMLSFAGNGSITYQIVRTMHQTFRLESHIERPVTALLQFRRYTRWTPVDFPPKSVQSNDSHTVPIQLKAEETLDSVLSMAQENTYQLDLANYSPSADPKNDECILAIRDALAHGAIPDAAKADFVQCIEDLEMARQSSLKIESLSNRSSEIAADQAQLTKSLQEIKAASGDESSPLYRQMVQRAENNEKELAAITSELYALQKDCEDIQMRMRELAQRIRF